MDAREYYYYYTYFVANAEEKRNDFDHNVFVSSGHFALSQIVGSRW